MTNQSTTTNSLDQVNRDNQNWKDRHDVDKAFDDWLKDNLFIPSTVEEIKAFATFFAERVKGAPIAFRGQSRARQCNHCDRPYYPHESEADRKSVFCCKACENGY